MAPEPHDPPDRKLERLRADARERDSDQAAIERVKRLRRHLPGDEDFGDALSTAGDKPSDAIGRQISAASAARPSLLGEVGLGAIQVWRAITDGAGRGERELTILFTDLVGFSSWALNAGDEAAVELLREVGDAVEPAVGDHLGKVVKRLGDGLMATFLEPGDAVEAALEAHDRLAGIEIAGHRPQMRAGVHHGKPRKVSGDYLGVDVNIAARVAEQAKGGQLLISDDAAGRLPDGIYSLGRARKLRADGAPKDLRVRTVQRA